MKKYVKKDRKDFHSKPKRGSRDRKSFGDRSRGRRGSGRDRPRRDRGKSDLTMTRVTCSDCGNKCEVPFKPTSDKPVYCSDCFKKKGGGSADSKFDLINEKLDKIMGALDIE
tara:strand:- start:1354 stop:1689 length:336 start_codon:yes stop_codon:yes gene_type:complete